MTDFPDTQGPDETRNVAAALFRLEHNCDEQDMLEVLGSLVEWLKAPEQTGLRRAFVVWIRWVLLPHRAPGMELPEFNELQDLHEVHDMLAERIKKWPERWIEEGEQRGREEGRQEGRQEGEQLRAEQTARNLIKLGVLSDEQIAEATGLTTADVEALRAEDRH
ncbi:hypothetical protein [Halomonas ventosae]|uniref:Putative transposase/invertase (TIGR01784 family) n=1 Tax=Halomonas ventosae TaxID=229007 RepID=A0A4R6GKU9_9GAMM|nr:hypothetical protein [Halomonas ventosae]TDN95752.1 putative transposase/invertase (TIGR01784 family) [Halomonas ventosae]